MSEMPETFPNPIPRELPANSLCPKWPMKNVVIMDLENNSRLVSIMGHAIFASASSSSAACKSSHHKLFKTIRNQTLKTSQFHFKTLWHGIKKQDLSNDRSILPSFFFFCGWLNKKDGQNRSKAKDESYDFQPWSLIFQFFSRFKQVP